MRAGIWASNPIASDSTELATCWRLIHLSVLGCVAIAIRSRGLLRFCAALVMQCSAMHRAASPCLSLPFFAHWLDSRSPPQTPLAPVFEEHFPYPSVRRLLLDISSFVCSQCLTILNCLISRLSLISVKIKSHKNQSSFDFQRRIARSDLSHLLTRDCLLCDSRESTDETLFRQIFSRLTLHYLLRILPQNSQLSLAR